MASKRLLLAALIGGAACGGVHLQSPVATSPAPVPATPPQTFVVTSSELRMTRVIDVRDGMTRVAAFRAVSDYLAQKYSIDVSDARAGFLMTPWQNSRTRSGTPDLHYRTRVIVRLSEDGKQASLRTEANWQRGDEWDVGYDTQMLEDLVVEMRTRIGKKS